MPDKAEVKTERKLEEVFGDISEKMTAWHCYASLQKRGEYGAKEAGAVSRKAGMELGALLKEWRRVSVAAHRDDDAE